MPALDDPRHDREVGARDSTLDTTRIDDVRIGAVRPLITPALLQERVPVRDDTLALVEVEPRGDRRRAARRATTGWSSSSARARSTTTTQALEYAQRLQGGGRRAAATTCWS